MASSGNTEVRVPIGIPVETNAAEAADEVDHLREAILKSRDVIRDASSNLRGLRGSTDAIKAAKDQLKATIDKEKAAVSDATLKLVKQGTTYDRVAAQTKKFAKEQDDLKKTAADALKKSAEDRAKGLGDAISRAGGPVASLRDRLKSLGSIAGGEGASGLSVLTFAAVGLTAAAAALVVGVAAATISLAKWALKGADAARSMQLVREASTTTAQNASNLGTQIAALGAKVPTSTAALNDLAASLARSGIGGQATVDLLNAVGQANTAIGESSGAKIREIVERGKLARRMFLGLHELEGTGLDFTDVAASLATGMKVSVKEAQLALLEGRVKLGDGAKAMRDAVEKKFGGINLRKMMSLENIAATLGKKFDAMTSGINLEPAIAAATKFFAIFDEGTATGAVLKRAVTMFGNGVVNVLEKGAPIAQSFIRGMIIGGLKMYIAYLQLKNQLKETFGGSDILKNVDTLKVALAAGEVVVTSFALGVAALGGAIALAAASAYYFVKASRDLGASFSGALTYVTDLETKLTTADWAGMGRSIIDGLVSGLKSGAELLKTTVTGLADSVKKGFMTALNIHSPSKVFEGYGKNTAAGYTKGVDAGAGDAQGAVRAMGAAPPTMRDRGALGGGGPPPATFNITLVLQGGGAPSDQVKDPSVLETLTKVIKEAAASAGYAVAAT